MVNSNVLNSPHLSPKPARLNYLASLSTYNHHWYPILPLTYLTLHSLPPSISFFSPFYPFPFLPSFTTLFFSPFHPSLTVAAWMDNNHNVLIKNLVLPKNKLKRDNSCTMAGSPFKVFKIRFYSGANIAPTIHFPPFYSMLLEIHLNWPSFHTFCPHDHLLVYYGQKHSMGRGIDGQT